MTNATVHILLVIIGSAQLVYCLGSIDQREPYLQKKRGKKRKPGTVNNGIHIFERADLALVASRRPPLHLFIRSLWVYTGEI